MTQNSKFSVKGTEITVYSDGDMDFISLTDMLRAKDGDFFISDWLRNRNTVEFLGIWEPLTMIDTPRIALMNADYHLVEFEDQFPDAGKLIVRGGNK